MKSKKGIFAVVVAVIVLVLIACIGIFRDFDAQGYVKAILDQRLKGEVADAKEIIVEVTEEELLEQYEDGIHEFVVSYITNEIEVDEKTEEKFEALTKEIFKAMKYQVHEAEKIDRTEYDVSVELQPSDVFPKFVEKVQKQSENLRAKVEKGEYQGTKEEISEKMKKEFVDGAYEALKEAKEERTYGESETIVFKVKSNEKNVFSIQEEDVSLLITKILGLDEIQD